MTDKPGSVQQDASGSISENNIIMRAEDNALAKAGPNTDAISKCGPMEIVDEQKPEKKIAGLSSQDGNLHIILPKEIEGKTPQVENRADGLKVSTWGDKNKPTHELWQYTSGASNGAEVLFQRTGDKMEIVSMLEAPVTAGIGFTRDFIQVHREGAQIKGLDVINTDTAKTNTYKIDEEENVTGVDVIAATKDHPPGYIIKRGGPGGFGLPMTTAAYVDLSGNFEMIQKTKSTNGPEHTTIRTRRHRIATQSEKYPDGHDSLPAGTAVTSKYFQRDNNPERLLSTSFNLPKGSPENTSHSFWRNLAKAGEPIKLEQIGARFRTPQSITAQTLKLDGNVPAHENVSGWLMDPHPGALKPGEAPQITLVRQVPAAGDKSAHSEAFAVWTLNPKGDKVISQKIIPQDDRETEVFPDEDPI